MERGNGAAFHLNSSCKQKLLRFEKRLHHCQGGLETVLMKKVSRKANVEDKLLISFKH